MTHMDSTAAAPIVPVTIPVGSVVLLEDGELNDITRQDAPCVSAEAHQTQRNEVDDAQ
jgi:hypothetical protein